MITEHKKMDVMDEKNCVKDLRCEMDIKIMQQQKTS
jgi:hypothetical protein